MTLVDLIGSSTVVAFGVLWLVPRTRDLSRSEAQVVAASFLMHIAFMFVVLFVAYVLYKGVTDFVGFQNAGDVIAAEIRNDPIHVAPRAVALFFHQDVLINVPLNLEGKGGRSTVSMWIVSAFGSVLFGGSHLATATACTLFSFAGKLAMFRTFREYFPARVRPAVGAAFLLVPSVVFWTSGLIKEAIAVGALGFAIAGVKEVLLLRRPRGLIPLVCGMVVVACTKPYLLIAMGVGVGAWIYSERAIGPGGRIRVRPLWLIGAMAIALVGVLVIGRLFPNLAFDTLGEQAARMQFYGQRAAGGSYYMLGDPSELSLFGQLKYAPLALFTALFRPLLPESSNIQIFANSLETTAILAATLVILFRRGWRWMATTIISNPGLAFAIGFALPVALGVGLVSNNLGTLSRYRCPSVPFVVLTLVALYQMHRTAPIKARDVVLRLSEVPRRRSRGAPVPALRTSGPRADPSA